MRSKGFRLVLFLIGGWLAATANSAVAPAQGKRVAMVIGNSAYHTPYGDQNRQVPWEHSALRARFYLHEAAQGGAITTGPLQLGEAAQAWSATKDTTSRAVLSAFVAGYDGTVFAELARARLKELSKKPLPPLPIRPLRRNRPRSIPSTAFGWERTRVEKPVRGPAPGRWSFNKVWSKVWAVRSTPWASSPSITLPGLTPR